MNPRDRIVLQKIKQYCIDIEKLVERFGNDLEVYESDFAYQYACNMCILQIGELVGQLSDQFKESFPDVPWHLIKGMRNLFAHDYGNIDLEIVWETIQTNIPELEQKCGEILARE